MRARLKRNNTHEVLKTLGGARNASRRERRGREEGLYERRRGREYKGRRRKNRGGSAAQVADTAPWEVYSTHPAPRHLPIGARAHRSPSAEQSRTAATTSASASPSFPSPSSPVSSPSVSPFSALATPSLPPTTAAIVSNTIADNALCCPSRNIQTRHIQISLNRFALFRLLSTPSLSRCLAPLDRPRAF